MLDDNSEICASFLTRNGQKPGVFAVEDPQGRDSAGGFGQWASLNGDSLWLNRGHMVGAMDGKAPSPLADHVNPARALDEALANATLVLRGPSATAQPTSSAVNA